MYKLPPVVANVLVCWMKYYRNVYIFKYRRYC